jgi:hypothetical protein
MDLEELELFLALVLIREEMKQDFEGLFRS